MAIYREATVRVSIGPAGFSPTMLQGAFAPAFTRPRPATEGGPLIGDGRWHRTLGRGERSTPAGATLGSAKQTSLDDALNEPSEQELIMNK